MASPETETMLPQQPDNNEEKGNTEEKTQIEVKAPPVDDIVKASPRPDDGNGGEDAKIVSPTNVFSFADADEMKKKVRQALLKKEPYNVFDFYHKEGIWRHIATHPVFENVTLGVIALNAIWMWIDTDFNKSESLLEADAIFQVMEHFFCAYFTFEWVCRFMAFKRKLDGLKDGWFKFDSCLVFLMVLETWVFTIMTLAQGGDGGSPLGGQTALLRLFRLLRLSRLLRMLRSLPELMVLIKGMITAMKSVLYVLGMLVAVLYVFSIAFVQLAPNNPPGRLKEDFFLNVPLGMYSLFIHGTFFDDLADFTDQMRAEADEFSGMLALILIFVFMPLASLTIMNMLIGVLCEVVSAVAAEEKEAILTETVTEKMSIMIQGLDTDSNDKISYKEFKQILNIPKALHALQEVGVDPVGIVDFADYFFSPRWPTC
eukprot:gnl/TRDRNA2_/TRDRNA2_176707_c2_seq2.p1 gnl/TRDRNA2_/TRDRNA2_176707_c2~~gnl/TRDRNA2_/TRDRNA2_176707_c2_seq2.p1  ORF type:complete len:429 (-),score=109.29 gnl/TRDRNA2_/TRDRNA2_176707_c2_seq2:800-2086(-)